jgi:hypothetical protein
MQALDDITTAIIGAAIQIHRDLKSVERLAPVHGKQLLTYLRLMNKRVGLPINFGGYTLMDGLHRIVNDLPSSASPRLRVNQSARVQRGGKSP